MGAVRPAFLVAVLAVVGGAGLMYANALALKAVMGQGNVVEALMYVAWSVIAVWAYVKLVADEIQGLIDRERVRR